MTREADFIHPPKRSQPPHIGPSPTFIFPAPVKKHLTSVDCFLSSHFVCIRCFRLLLRSIAGSNKKPFIWPSKFSHIHLLYIRDRIRLRCFCTGWMIISTCNIILVKGSRIWTQKVKKFHNSRFIKLSTFVNTALYTNCETRFINNLKYAYNTILPTSLE